MKCDIARAPSAQRIRPERRPLTSPQETLGTPWVPGIRSTDLLSLKEDLEGRLVIPILCVLLFSTGSRRSTPAPSPFPELWVPLGWGEGPKGNSGEKGKV